MEKVKFLWCLCFWSTAFCLLPSACSATGTNTLPHASARTNELVIQSSQFFTRNPEICRFSDVALDKMQIADFFRLAQRVSLQELNKNYYFAPCHLEGKLQRGKTSCFWKIQASAIGEITCDGATTYFACNDETCYRIFEGSQSVMTSKKAQRLPPLMIKGKTKFMQILFMSAQTAQA